MDGRLVDRRPAVFGRKLVIESARQNTRGRRFSDAANTRQQISLMNAIEVEGVLQCAHHRLLADEISKPRRAVFARQNAIGGLLLRLRPKQRWPVVARDGWRISRALVVHLLA